MKARAVLTLVASLLLLIPAGAAAAVDLHVPHQGTTVACDGDVLWHFVHNQVSSSDTTVGELTATFSGDGEIVVGAYKVLRSVRHYEVITSGGDTLLSASDNISGGNLVLSHWECLPGEPPPPDDECVAGDTVAVYWDARLGLPTASPELVLTDSSPTTMLPGTYEVTLTSTDMTHAPGHQPGQLEEQWFVALYSGSTLVATSSAIGDLAEADTTLTQSVGQVTLTTSVDTAVAMHVNTDGSGWASAESVEPTMAVFTCL